MRACVRVHKCHTRADPVMLALQVHAPALDRFAGHTPPDHAIFDAPAQIPAPDCLVVHTCTGHRCWVKLIASLAVHMQKENVAALRIEWSRRRPLIDSQVDLAGSPDP